MAPTASPMCFGLFPVSVLKGCVYSCECACLCVSTHSWGMWGFGSPRSTLVQQLFTVRTLHHYSSRTRIYAHVQTIQKMTFVALMYCHWHCSNMLSVLAIINTLTSRHTHVHSAIRNNRPPPLLFPTYFMTAPALSINQRELARVITWETGRATDVKPLERLNPQSPHHCHLSASTRVMNKQTAETESRVVTVPNTPSYTEIC